MAMKFNQVLRDAHLDEQVETAIFQYIQERVASNKEYTVYDVERYLIDKGWGYLPTAFFLQCYRKAVNYYAEVATHKQEVLV